MGLKSLVLAAALVVLFVSRTGAAVVFNFVLDPATTAGGGSTSTFSGLGTYHLYAYDDTLGSQGIAAYNVELTGVDSVFDRTPTTAWTDADDNSWDAGFGLLRSTFNNSTLVAAQPLMPLETTGQPPPITGLGRQAGDFASAFPGAQSFANTTSSAWGSNVTRPAHDPSLPWLLVAEGEYTDLPGLVLGAQGTNVNLYNSEMRQFAADICLFSDGACHSVRTTPPPVVPDPVTIPPPPAPRPQPTPPLPTVVGPAPPEVDPLPPEVTPPPVNPDLPPVSEVPPAILPIEIIDVLPDDTPRIEVPPWLEPIAELPVVDPVPSIEEPPTSLPSEIITLPYIPPDGWLQVGRFVLTWGETIGSTIDVSSVIDVDDAHFSAPTIEALLLNYAVALDGGDQLNGQSLGWVRTSAGYSLATMSSLDAEVPEPTGAVLAVLAMLAFSLRRSRSR
jgi:hypothetical protein